MNAERVLDIFKEITTVPRESGHEELIIAYLQKFAADRSLECKTDEAGNVVIIKPAAPGKENVPTVVLQSHSDMVCEKNNGVEHDFRKDPIKYIIKDGWMIAPDTTLGADCGIGMAAELAVLEDPTPMGKIECLFTVSEETSLIGAQALKPGFISGKILLNLDSEDEGELFVGCAGGIDTKATFNYSSSEAPEGATFLKLTITNCLGGHSGEDINKFRANAVQLMGRFLYGELGSFALCSIDGGGKINAIARECSAVVAVKDAESLKANFAKFGEGLKKKYYDEPDIACVVASAPASNVINDVDAQCVISALVACPHGILGMSRDLPGLVETSSNLAYIHMVGENQILVGTSQRTSIEGACKMIAAKARAVFELAGASVVSEGEYPGWQPKLSSHILEVSKKAYVDLFGVEPKVRAIHAGLECGLFLHIYPDLDMVSFGPTLRGVHAPGEKLNIPSLDKFVKLLDKILLDL